MVVGHGGLTSDSGGNGGALRRRRTAATSTLRLSGEVDELWRKKMESWASWKRRFHGGERAGRRRGLLGNGGGAALGSGERARRDAAQVKQIG